MTYRGPDRPWSHDIPDGPWDTVVIGSGMGGMTAAALLAKVGKRVLVLEQHNIPGGFTQMFKRPGYAWDVGVHLVGEVTERSYPGRLLSALTDGRLTWEPVGEIYDEFNFPDGFTVQLPDSAEGFRDTMIDAFPDERAAIDEYLLLIKHAARATAKMLQARAMPRALAPGGRKAAEAAQPHLTTTTADVLRSLTDDPRLRAVLAAQWGYYGATPERSSFGMHALMVRHFLHGAWYPVGGAASIAPALLQTVADAGGWCAVRRSVTEIVVARGRVQGVRLDDDTMIPTTRVVSTAGAIPTSELLADGLADADDEPYRTPGPGHVSLYLGFMGDIAAAGANRYCQWYYRSWDLEDDLWDVAPGQDLGPAPVLFCSFPSLKDPTHEPGPEQRHTGEVITFVPWSAFSRWEGTKWKRRGADYDAFKQELTDALLAQYLERYPGLRSMVDHVELSTPVSTHHFARSAQGSIYGLGTEPARFADRSIRPKTRIKGLFLGGVDASAPGIVGALSGGALSAAAVEPLRVARFLQPIMRRPG